MLYIKPRNTLIAAGDTAQVDDAAPELEVGAALGLVIGRTAGAVPDADALDHVAGYLVVAGFSVPHDSFCRPQIRFKPATHHARGAARRLAEETRDASRCCPVHRQPRPRG